MAPAAIDRRSRKVHNPLFNDTVTFIETCLESGGARTVVELQVSPGGGNPVHRHTAFTETFEPIEGVLGLHQAGRELRLQPGESATIRIGQAHRFYNSGNAPVRSRVTLVPGHLGMEQVLMIMYGLAADGFTDARGIPKDRDILGYVSVLGDTRLVGPLALVGPLFNFWDRRARARGKAVELTRRYVLDCSNPAAHA